MKWNRSLRCSCDGRIAFYEPFPKFLPCNFRNNMDAIRKNVGRWISPSGYRSWIGNFVVDRAVTHPWWTRRTNCLFFTKLLCSATSNSGGERRDRGTHLADDAGDIFYPKDSKERETASDTETCEYLERYPHGPSQGSGSKKRRRRERIPHTRERRDMFWRGVTTVNKVEAHAGLTTFAMVVRSLEAKPVFTPPCSPPRRGYLLDDDYNLHIVASTASFGKKAVPRVRARRRLREACRRIFPFHARRHKEYTITAHPVVLFAKWEDILADVYEALKRTNCYVEYIDS